MQVPHLKDGRCSIYGTWRLITSPSIILSSFHQVIVHCTQLSLRHRNPANGTQKQITNLQPGQRGFGKLLVRSQKYLSGLVGDLREVTFRGTLRSLLPAAPAYTGRGYLISLFPGAVSDIHITPGLSWDTLFLSYLPVLRLLAVLLIPSRIQTSAIFSSSPRSSSIHSPALSPVPRLSIVRDRNHWAKYLDPAPIFPWLVVQSAWC